MSDSRFLKRSPAVSEILDFPLFIPFISRQSENESLLRALLYFDDVLVREEIRAHMFVEDGVDATQVFEPHHSMLNLFVAVVFQNAAQLVVTGRLRPLII